MNRQDIKTPLVILISGESVTGKTTIGKKIAEKFDMPFIGRDEIKEIMFENLGWKDREWSHKVGLAAYSLIYYFIEHLLSSGNSFVLESTFKPTSQREQEIGELKEKYNFKLLQIYTKADANVLIQRFTKRSNSDERHPGHVDNMNLEEFKQKLLLDKHKKLNIDGKYLEIDTTNFEDIDYEQIFKKLGNWLSKQGCPMRLKNDCFCLV